MYTFAIIALFLVMFGAANLAFICVVANRNRLAATLSVATILSVVAFICVVAAHESALAS